MGRVALMPEVKDGLKRAEGEERKSDTLMNCLSRGGGGRGGAGMVMQEKMEDRKGTCLKTVQNTYW